MRKKIIEPKIPPFFCMDNKQLDIAKEFLHTMIASHKNTTNCYHTVCMNPRYHENYKARWARYLYASACALDHARAVVSLLEKGV
jgi:hypothetical protein